jgi:hypothetical protein
MNDRILLRAAGLCAIAAALLHIPGLDTLAGDPGKQFLYVAIDVLLTFALFGLYAGVARFRGVLGTIGFVGAIVALLVIRTGARMLPGADVYALGATLFTVSLAIASLSLVRERGLIRYAAMAWIGSLAFGLAAKVLSAIYPGAIILFCVGFLLAGLALLRAKA